MPDALDHFDARARAFVERVAASLAPFETPGALRFVYPAGEGGGLLITASAFRRSMGRGEWRDLPVRAYVEYDVLRQHPPAGSSDDDSLIVGHCRDVVWNGPAQQLEGRVDFLDSVPARVAWLAAKMTAGPGLPLIGLSVAGACSNREGSVPDAGNFDRDDKPECRETAHAAANPGPVVVASVQPAFLDIVSCPSIAGARFVGVAS